MDEHLIERVALRNGIWMYLSIAGLLAVVWGSFIMYSTRPSDVLREVQALREDLARSNAQTIYRPEFESFLERNPDLKRPSIRVTALEEGGVLIETKIVENLPSTNP